MVTRQDKRLAVGRLGALVEQIEALVSKDLQVILVSRSARHCLSYSHPQRQSGDKNNASVPVICCRRACATNEGVSVDFVKGTMGYRLASLDTAKNKEAGFVQVTAGASITHIQLTSWPEELKERWCRVGNKWSSDCGATEIVPPACPEQQPSQDADQFWLAHHHNLQCVSRPLSLASPTLSPKSITTMTLHRLLNAGPIQDVCPLSMDAL